ncbi:MAG: hypothetical protein COA86_15615, partial [Kangiella sp.]
MGSELPGAAAALGDLDPHNLVRALIQGVLPNGTSVLRHPSPNIMFTRDLGVIVGQARLLTFAAKPARRREMRLSRALMRHHPVFGDGPLLDISQHVASPALEGGDVLVLSADQVAIGVGARTDERSARAAAALLHSTGVSEVHLVKLRASRATMHLDTVFTLIDDAHCLAFGPLVTQKSAAQVTTLQSNGSESQRTGSLLDVLAESGLPLTPIYCGDAHPI